MYAMHRIMSKRIIVWIFINLKWGIWINYLIGDGRLRTILGMYLVSVPIQKTADYNYLLFLDGQQQLFTIQEMVNNYYLHFRRWPNITIYYLGDGLLLLFTIQEMADYYYLLSRRWPTITIYYLGYDSLLHFSIQKMAN